MPNLQTLAGLDGFNALSPADAERELLACCASRAFAEAVAARRPHRDLAQLTAAADVAVRALAWPDVLEALEAHPRIGARVTEKWSAQEQAGVGEAERDELAEGNRVYEDRFGHVYLVCATGLSGEQMLRRLRERLLNDEESERRVVVDELAKITRLRMAKLVGAA
ncbi:2-oxo-4-hydroxy-4-carboxy-5-ureidoimidazoline decarboxylase [Nonomuraea sp. NBC_01738]|uniref:2-oxo-4-hydroxy-4-carboxy-5-ureidoimidazoline decarboxylase n=1 Tax=Nonomuraea sp. NBC_01738 TaxID=2976003 RepID=UPI002E10C524|nr:2-oxo-4-hydroxy-4-carboxy-5-ureidoimidazoline decarboxylase [Nonomuraea sp. NBC_01738]